MGLLDGKVAIVTGAGHGIGRGHALELARQGAKVVVNDLGGSVRGEGAGKAADETVALIEQAGGTAVPNYADVSNYEQAGQLVQQAIDTYGTLDILINNAGIVRDAAVWNMPEADFDAVMAVHVKGTWNTSSHASKYWRAQSKQGQVRGRIINTTSGAGLGGNFGQSGYATAKAAIVGLTLTLAIELYKMGVTVNAIGPAGLTRITASIPGAGDAFEPNDLGDDEFHAMDPAGSSPLAAWLASDDAQYVTGQVIRCLDDRIIWMQGWTERKVIHSGNKRWKTEELPGIMAQKIFEVRPSSLDFKSSRD
jgi:NAD(P)-dependent dehydrogenase (short-subunit alcohol dehydrogenase family)